MPIIRMPIAVMVSYRSVVDNREVSGIYDPSTKTLEELNGDQSLPIVFLIEKNGTAIDYVLLDRDRLDQVKKLKVLSYNKYARYEKPNGSLNLLSSYIIGIDCVPYHINGNHRDLRRSNMKRS